jgi:hypothetical protein
VIVKSGKKEGILNKKILAKGKNVKKIFRSFLYTSNLIVLTLLIGLMFVKPDILKNGFNKVYNVVYSKNYLHYPEAVLKYFASQFVVADYIQIDIKHMDMQKLEYTRQKRMNGVGGESGNVFEYVPAGIRRDGQAYDAKIRLKGDRQIHYEDINKLSFRVKLDGDNTLFGMKVFSLQKPRARNYIYEWLLLEMMKQEGIIAPEYKFINANLNGKDLGVYALEEHYGKHLIERYGHREGPIIRFSENLRARDFRKTSILPFRKKKWMAEENVPATKRAVYLLEEFIRGKTNLAKTFDVKKLANFYAIADLFEAHHGYLTKSLRFYHNPVTGKLEPIPFDGHYNQEKHYLLEQGLPLGESFFIAAERGINPDPANNYYTKVADREYLKHIFNNPKTFDLEFFEQYIQILKKISDPEYLDQFFEKIKEPLDYNLKMIYKNFPMDDNFSYYGPGPFYFHESLIYKKQNKIRELLKKQRESVGDIRIHGAGVGSDYILLEILPRQGKLPVEILGASCGDIDVTLEKREVIVATHSMEAQKIKILIRPGHQLVEGGLGCFVVRYKILGLPGEKQVSVLPWSLFEDKYMSDDIMGNDGNVSQFEFIEVDESSKTIAIKPGDWVVDQKLIIPAGYSLNISAGTKIDLRRDGLILSYSPLNIQGTKENPVRIGSEGESGQGLVVLQAGKMSRIRHAHFDNLSSARSKGWNLTGALTFYESPVEMSNVKISANKSEDALNIVRSSFSVKDSIFSDGFSDAIDVDFGEGVIETSQFNRPGNDAIDVSGTKVTLRDISISDAGDKGISAGENSVVEASNISIWNSSIAVASKDKSRVNLNVIKLANAAVGFSAYQKKSEFGPGYISIHGLSHEGIQKLYLVEENSEVLVDGVAIREKLTDVKEILYPSSN